LVVTKKLFLIFLSEEEGSDSREKVLREREADAGRGCGLL
jgi:hypothetical protein